MLKILLNTLILVSFVLISTIKIKAQQVIHDNIITLDQPDQGNKVYMADEKIEFLPGYEFEGSGGDKMKAYISPYGDFLSSTDFTNHELDDNFQVGSLSGIHDVTESGGFAYTIPIDLPKGANGMMPQLSINYNNQSGNGILGMGWNLQGLSMITRTVKPTYFQDEEIHFNFRGPTSVNTNYEDAFALDGMLLIGVEGDYGYPNSVYATEVENYNRIISHGTQGEGPEWFEVRTKDGMTIKYGLSSQSRVNNHDGTALIWLIEYIEDQNGNYIVYTYDETEEEVLISSIKYSGNTNNGINPPTEVKFEYSHRKDPFDYFFDGKRIKNRHIIKSIEVVKEGGELYKYEFSFGFDLYTFLNKVSIKVNDIEKYNPLIFQYGKKEDEIFEPADLILNNQNNTVMVDFNPNYFYHPGATDLTGNGLTDMYQFSTSRGANNLSDPTPASRLHIFKNNGNNDFKKVKELQLPNNLILNGIDSNGEITNSGGHVLMRNTSNINPIDFDGDGKQDLLYFKLQNSIKYDKSEEDYVPLTNRLERVGYLRSEINNGDYDFNSLESNLLDAGNSGISHLHIWNINQFNFQGDFTGNGVTDILIAGCNISQSTFGITIIPGNPQRANNLAVDNGSSFLLEGADAEFITKSDFVHVIDFNGDGRSDIMAVKGSVTKVFTFETSDETDYSSGSGIVLDLQAIATELYSSGFPTQWHDFKLGDFNGDGKTDILTLNENQNKFTVHYSSGRWFLAEEFELEAQLSNSWRVKDELFPYDFNGDGKSDIIHFTYGVNASRDGFFAHKQIYSSNGNNFSTSPRDINFYNKDFGNIVVRLTNYSSSEGLRFTYEDGSTSTPATPNSAINVYTSKLPDTEYIRGNLKMSLASSIGDFSGDGTLDLSVAFNLSVAANSNLEQRTSFSYQDLYSIIELNPYSNFLFLEGVKNGLGITHDIAYTRHNYAINYIETEDLLNYPLVEFVQRVPVVDNVIIKDHPQNKIAENLYNFKNPVIHQRGKGFLGFTEINTTDQVNESKTSRFYSIFEENILQTSIYDWDQNHFSLYLAKTEVYSEVAEELVFKSEYNYEFEDLSDKRRLQFLQVVTSENFISETVENEYSVYNHINGNLEYRSSSVNVNEYTKIEEFEYGEFASLLGLENRIIEHSEVVNRLGENPFEAKTSFDYNIQNGNLIEQKTNVNTPFEITEEYNHDDFGNVIKTTVRTSGLQDRVSETIYDSNGRLPIEVINEMEQNITIQYHPKFDKPVSINDIDGLMTTAIYDNFGNLAYSVGKEGIVTEIEKSWFNIDPPTTNNNPVSADDVMWYTKVATSGKPTRWVYFNRLGQKRMKVIQGKDAPIATISTYDQKGHMVAETDPHLVGSSNINYLEITFDEYNRVKNVSENNQMVSYTYEVESGLQKTIINNPDGTTNTIYKDALDNLIKSEDDGGLSEYSYYSHGGLKEVKLNNEVVATSNYDVLGRQNELIDVNAGVITYEYNAFGDITKMTNANNEVKTYVYDEFGRLEQTDNNGNIVNYEYVTSGNGINNINKISTSSHEQTFEYDMFNRMVKTTEIIDGESFEFEYILNNLNQLDQIIHPNGFIVNNTYDNNGYLVKVEDENNNLIWEGLSQDAFGRFDSYRKGDGVITELFFDAFENLEEIDAGSVQHHLYDWDSETGNLTNRKDLINGMEEFFEYDNLNRLRKATTSVIGSSVAMIPLEVNYLSNGNIKDKTDAGDYEYHPTKPNAVTEVTNDIQEISLLTQDITYNALNKASTISEGDYTLEFIYGHDKERRKTTFDLNGLTREKYFVGLYEKEIEGNTIRHINYVTAGDGMTAIVVEEEENGNTETETYFTYKDHLGSIVALTDENGNIVLEQSFDAWGRYRNPSDWTYNNVTTTPTWLRGYTGHEHLPHFELINMNGRIYDPILGRMLSPDNYIQDPLFSQSYNRYSYVWNNPLKYTDPSGEVVWYAPIIAGALIQGTIGAIRAQNDPYTNTATGILRGVTVGAVGGALSLVGGGSFVANVAFGALSGAVTGSLDAALWGNDVGKGALYGAAIGGALALGQSTFQSVNNYRDYGMFGTNDGVFNRMVDEAVSGGTVNATKGQNALDFWTDRYGGPSMTFKSTGSPSTSSMGDITITGQKFINGSRHVRRAIAHEYSHYVNNVNWDNGKVGTTVSNPKFINLDRTKFRGDGVYGYNGAIKLSGKYHIGYQAISEGKTAPLVAPAWKQFGWTKWFYLVPRRF